MRAGPRARRAPTGRPATLSWQPLTTPRPRPLQSRLLLPRLLLLVLLLAGAALRDAGVRAQTAPAPAPPSAAESPSAASASAQRVQVTFKLVAATRAAAAAGPGLRCPQSISYTRVAAYTGLDAPRTRDNAAAATTANAVLFRNVVVDGVACNDTDSGNTAMVLVDLAQSPPSADVGTAQPFFLRGTDNSRRSCGPYQPDYPYLYFFTDQMARFQERFVASGLVPANNSALLAARPSEIYMVAQPYLGGKTDGSVVSIAVCTFKGPDLFVNASISPSPSPNADGANNSGQGNKSRACFPGSATVTVAGSRFPRRMDQLALGTRVLVPRLDKSFGGDDDSAGHDAAFSDVYLFTHRLVSERATYLEIWTDANASITLSPGHYLLTQARGMVPAGDIKPGQDWLLRADGSPARVTSVRRRRLTGVYAPHTLDGRIIVDGFVASTYTTACPPRLAHALLAPLRIAYRAVGLCVPGLVDAGLDAPILAPVRAAVSLRQQLRLWRAVSGLPYWTVASIRAPGILWS